MPHATTASSDAAKAPKMVEVREAPPGTEKTLCLRAVGLGGSGFRVLGLGLRVYGFKCLGLIGPYGVYRALGHRNLVVEQVTFNFYRSPYTIPTYKGCVFL